MNEIDEILLGNVRPPNIPDDWEGSLSPVIKVGDGLIQRTVETVFEYTWPMNHMLSSLKTAKLLGEMVPRPESTLRTKSCGR